MREYSLITALINCFKHESEKRVMKGYKAEVRNNLMDGLLENLDMENFLETAKKTNDEFYIYLLVYYSVYQLEKHRSDVKYFYDLKELLKKHHDKFGTMGKFSLWVIMETYCISRLAETGDTSFNKEVFSIYKDMLELKIYKASPVEDFNIIRFRNIVRTASLLKEFEWLGDFIGQYSPELNERHKEDMKNYSLALVSFGNKDFEESLKYIMKVQFELFLYKVDMKILQLKIYFELKYYEQTLSSIDSALHYLKNTKDLADPHKETVRKFIRYLNELVKIVNSPEMNKDELSFLRKKISDEKAVNSREWFFEKIDFLNCKL